VIFDFGGVLTSPLFEGLAAFSADHAIDLSELARAALGAYAGGQDALVTDFELGRIDEHEFTRELALRLSELAGRPIDPDGLIARLFRVRIEDRMLDAVASIRAAGFKTGLVSNSWGMSLYPLERLDGLFDARIISGEVGLRKPDPAIFHLAVERLRVEPGSCVFVDDDPTNLAVAESAGMAVVLHKTAAETIVELEARLDVRLG
jgi:putative hydrolase of the HAD superfamily